MDDKESSVQAALAEFAALRSEALQSFSMQWNAVALQLTATAVLVSFSLTERSRTGFLLIVPIVSYVLNGRYLRSEYNIGHIAAYIMEKLDPRVPGGLGWEEWLRKSSRGEPVIRWFASGPLLFCAISVLTLVWVVPYIMFESRISTVDRWMLGVAWVLDFGLTIASLYTTAQVFKIPLKLRRRQYAGQRP